MKIINAYWEKRNLNENTLEIIIDKSDNNLKNTEIVSNINDAIDTYDAKYIVVKLESLVSYNIKYLIDSIGFFHIETQLFLLVDIKRYQSIQLKFLDKHREFICRESKNGKDWDFIISKICEGIFYTDRIAIDPKYGIDIANKRYANWVADIKTKDKYKLFITYQNNVPFGFHILKFENNKAMGIIGGVFKEYQAKPIGSFWGYTLIKAISIDYNNITASIMPVSTNNLNVIKVWSTLGAIVENIKEVYIKHL